MEITHDIGFFDTGANCPDLVIENGDLKAEYGLQTAVLISLFSDRVVERDEDLPDGETDPRGWWADTLAIPDDDRIGSLIWTIDKSKTTQLTANRLKEFAEISLDWMIEDGIASSITVEPEIVASNQIDLAVRIQSPDDETFQFKYVWDGQLKVSQGT